ncbi:MAG: penicillin-binding protein 2 [Merismopedia sp. SIO2A8]|nr:penicillin-binding protein 2 [Merismopedia sp. SIO2A8]
MVSQPHYAPVAVVRSRLLMVWMILMVGIVGLIGNLVRLQVFEADKLQAMAQAQHGISLKPFIPRRPVVDRMGNTLAVDRQEYILYVHPIGFQDPSQEHKLHIAEQLAPILNQEPSAILDTLNLRDSGIKLSTGLTEDEAKRIRALQIDGLDLSPYQARFYPYGSLFAHVVGYTNLDREGQVGVEHSQSDLLSYHSPTLNLNRTAYGALMPGGVPEDFKYHEHLNLRLTVDNRLQRRIRTLLQEEISRLTAKRGLAIVMEVNTGAIRAMVTEPTYDPNGIHTTDDIPRMVNSVVSHLYEPGSTFKPINVAIALESGRLNPNDIIHDSGQIAIGTWSIGNHDFNTEGARGDLTVSDVMKYSSNIGMIRIMQKLDRDQYYDWLGTLGLGQLTGIDLPFETPALVKSRQQFTESAVESATTAFGQGFSLTPLQLLQMQAAIGNGGTMATPHVVDGLFDHDGQRYWTPERAAHQPVFSEDTTEIVLDMMETVVTEGTGKAAQVPGYRIAGKTGTAQKVGDRGVYEEDDKKLHEKWNQPR